MAGKIERRELPIEIRVAKGEDESRKIAGHAAVFDSMSEELYGFREKIDPGAFTDAIKGDDVRALWNHNPDYVLGRNKAGTLRMSEDKTGLAVEIDPPDTQWARDLMVSIDRGDVNQMSFGFRVLDESWEKKDGVVIRTLKKVELFDVSPVTYPAYPETDVMLRSRELAIEEARSAGLIPEEVTSNAGEIEVMQKRLALAMLD